MDFPRIRRLPPYVFNIIGDLKLAARRAGEDIIDLGMGNPDAPTPPHVVQKLVEAVTKTPNHRYSVSKGIYKLRVAICDWYRRRYGVELDPDAEAIATIGSKEGLGHLALAILGPGDVVLCPSPTYPIHQYSVIIAGGDLRSVPMLPGDGFFDRLIDAVKQSWPKPKLLILNYPAQPHDRGRRRSTSSTASSTSRASMSSWWCTTSPTPTSSSTATRRRASCRCPARSDLGVEFFSLSKSYNMPGWRVGFAVGNREMIHALARMKSYLDYGMFQPVQIAAIAALNGPQDCVRETVRALPRPARRAVRGARAGRLGDPEAAARPCSSGVAFPSRFAPWDRSSSRSSCCKEGKVAVSPGIGFGEYGDEYVRFALIENEHRTRQAVRGIRKALGGEAAPSEDAHGG